MVSSIIVTGVVLEFIGTVLIGIAILRVHNRMELEHKIDRKVLKAIKREQWFTKLGLILISLGFIINIIGLYQS